MSEALSAFSNPSWWVLTVVVGLALNIFAPFVNRRIELFWAARSSKKAAELNEREAEFAALVERFRAKENGVVEAKLNAILFALKLIIACSLYLLAIQFVFSFSVGMVNFNFLAIPIALLGYLSVTRHWKEWRKHARIHNEVQTSPNEPEL